MSSLQIAGLVEKRHDNVKRTIEMLVGRGVIDRPQIEEDQIETGHGRKHSVQVCHLDERSSYIVVAQLSPEFTARLVDEWKALKEQASGSKALPNFGDPVAMARAWADQEEEKRPQAVQIEAMSEDVGALNRLSAADGAMTLTNTARGDQTRRTQGHGCKAYRVGQVFGHSSCYPWQALSEAVKQRDKAALC